MWSCQQECRSAWNSTRTTTPPRNAASTQCNAFCLLLQWHNNERFRCFSELLICERRDIDGRKSRSRLVAFIKNNQTKMKLVSDSAVFFKGAICRRASARAADISHHFAAAQDIYRARWHRRRCCRFVIVFFLLLLFWMMIIFNQQRWIECDIGCIMWRYK